VIKKVDIHKITETQIKKQIKEWLNINHIFWWYNLQGLGSQKGLPDLFAIHNGILWAIEVKTLFGRLSQHQANFLDNFIRAGEKEGLKTDIIVAKSVENVIEKFKKENKNDKENKRR